MSNEPGQYQPRTVDSTGTPAPASSRYSTKLVIGLILALVAIVFIPFGSLISLLLAIPAITLGHVGLREIKNTGEHSRELGLATLIAGYFTPAILIFLIIIGAHAATGPGGGRNLAPDKCSWQTEPTEKQEQACFDSYNS